MVTFLLVMGLKKDRNIIFFEIPLVQQSKSPAWQIVQKTFQALERSLHISLTPVPVWFSQFCLCWRQSRTRRPGVSVAFSSCPVGRTSPWNCPHSPPLTCRLSILQPARMNEHKCQSYQVVDKSVMMMWTKLSSVKFTKFQTHLIFIKRVHTIWHRELNLYAIISAVQTYHIYIILRQDFEKWIAKYRQYKHRLL